jgi:hypothetical protein
MRPRRTTLPIACESVMASTRFASLAAIGSVVKSSTTVHEQADALREERHEAAVELRLPGEQLAKTTGRNEGDLAIPAGDRVVAVGSARQDRHLAEPVAHIEDGEHDLAARRGRRHDGDLTLENPEPTGRLAALAEDTRAGPDAAPHEELADLGHDAVGQLAQQRVREDPFESVVHEPTL